MPVEAATQRPDDTINHQMMCHCHLLSSSPLLSSVLCCLRPLVIQHLIYNSTDPRSLKPTSKALTVTNASCFCTTPTSFLLVCVSLAPHLRICPPFTCALSFYVCLPPHAFTIHVLHLNASPHVSSVHVSTCPFLAHPSHMCKYLPQHALNLPYAHFLPSTCSIHPLCV